MYNRKIEIIGACPNQPFLRPCFAGYSLGIGFWGFNPIFLLGFFDDYSIASDFSTVEVVANREGSNAGLFDWWL